MVTANLKDKPLKKTLMIVMAVFFAHDAMAWGEVFSEWASAWGLNFHHFNGMTGAFYIVEEMAPGCALFDYDNDGDLDALIVQGQLLGPGKTMSDAVFPVKDGRVLTTQLFRNDLVIENGRTRAVFVDVSQAAGIQTKGYSIGVAVADIDNDGWLDFYLTQFGDNQLWHNQGDGTFRDITLSSGTGDPLFSVSASFVDYDRDGLLDLYVANYVKFTFANHKVCVSTAGVQDYCGPSSYEDERDRLYRNLGNGKFADVSQAMGILGSSGSGLGVISADFNQDLWPDIYVANDADPNFLWLNQVGVSFTDDGILSGSAVNMNGAAEASMGVDATDFDQDGDLDLFMTHLNGETNTLYINQGKGVFVDRTLPAKLGAPSLDKTGFGTAWLDYDNDGLLDLLIANGAVHGLEELRRLNDPFPLHQRNQLFHAQESGYYVEVTDQLGPDFAHSEVSRGVAVGDIDNDGDSDVLIANNNGPVRLLINEVGSKSHWVGFDLRLQSPKRHALGARLKLTQAERTLWQNVRTDGSYASARDPRVLFGLGSNEGTCRAEVYWPDGTMEVWSNLAIDRYWSLTQKQGAKP